RGKSPNVARGLRTSSEGIDCVDQYVRVRGAGAVDAYDDLSLILNRRAEDAPSDGDPRLREDRALSAELWPLADGRRRRSQKRKRECHDGGHPHGPRPLCWPPRPFPEIGRPAEAVATSTGARNRAGLLAGSQVSPAAVDHLATFRKVA